METSIPCPQCSEPITIEDFSNFSNPFTMKCPHCKTKLKETRITIPLLLLALVIIPLFIYIAATIKNLLSVIIPFLVEVPTVLFFIIFLYPLYALYERFNGYIIVTKGELKVKK
jgi:hypothetical protein